MVPPWSLKGRGQLQGCQAATEPILSAQASPIFSLARQCPLLVWSSQAHGLTWSFWFSLSVWSPSLPFPPFREECSWNKALWENLVPRGGTLWGVSDRGSLVSRPWRRYSKAKSLFLFCSLCSLLFFNRQGSFHYIVRAGFNSFQSFCLSLQAWLQCFVFVEKILSSAGQALNLLYSQGWPPLPEYWDYRYELPHSVNLVLGTKPKAWCMIGRHSTNWTIPPASCLVLLSFFMRQGLTV